MNRPPCAGVIVVVEDEEDTRELLRELLEARGYEVATAEDGIEALVVLKQTKNVCLVVLDLMMPRMNGFGVLAALAANPSLALLPVCITTSATDQAPVGLPCLPKPVDLGRLYQLIEEHCARALS